MIFLFLYQIKVMTIGLMSSPNKIKLINITFIKGLFINIKQQVFLIIKAYLIQRNLS